MGRRYIVNFKQVAVSAAQDLVQITGATGKIARIIRCWWGCTDTTLATSQSVATEIRLLPTTVTSGSGGSSFTPVPVDPGDPAASVAAAINNTTPATTSGTPHVLEESGDHIFNGYRSPATWLDGKSSPPLGAGEAIVFSVLNAPSGTVHLSGGVEFEEIGG